MPMGDEREKLPLDARILGDAIIELSISRRNVSVYPKGHPSIEGSLNRAFELLQRLFELRPEITIAIAKDTIIVDNYFLDRKNPVYKEFAVHLSSMNIASLTFISGLTKDELYQFDRILSEDTKEADAKVIQEALKKWNIIHIAIRLIDYSAFSFHEGKTEKEAPSQRIWERYIYGLLEGALQTEEESDAIQDIPPEMLANFLNKSVTGDIKEETYDRVITTYIRRSKEKSFSGTELKRILDFINGLRPELKKQFLSSALKGVPKDRDVVENALKDISADKVIEFLGIINKQKIAVPDALKNLLDKFSGLQSGSTEDLIFGKGLIADDIFLSPDVTNLLNEGKFETFVTDTYQKEIERLLNFDAKEIVTEKLDELNRECSDEYLEKDFNLIILELFLSNTISEEESGFFVDTLKEQAMQFIETGQYGQVLKIFMVLESDSLNKRFPRVTQEIIQYFNSPEFISQFIDSLRIIGRQMRNEALLLCDCYSEKIIPPLMDALSGEDSQVVRRFLISLITYFGDMSVPEAIKRLEDPRWFVKRNMLFILKECGGKEVIPHVRPLCNHENKKISFEAIRLLLKAGDSQGIDALRRHLESESGEVVEQAIAITGSFRVKEVLPNLLQMLKKKSVSGTDLHEKIPIIRALGQIGDPGALDALRDVLSSKSFLFKGALEKLKEEVYMALRSYPYEDIMDLIEAGLKSRNEQIRGESRKIRRQHGG